MSLRWLFVVQNFEIKSFADSAARIEVIQPVLQSGYVSEHDVLCFEGGYHSGQELEKCHVQLPDQSIENLELNLADSPVVIYGAGLHTRQHWSLLKALNIQAVTDSDSSLWGLEINGFTIIPPDSIAEYASDVVISSKAYEGAIYQELTLRLPALQVHGLYQHEQKNHGFDDMYAEINRKACEFKPDIIFYCPTHPADCLPADYWQKIRQQQPQAKFITIWWDYDESEHSPYLSFERDCLQWNDLCIENSNSTRLAVMKQRKTPYNEHYDAEKVMFHPTVFDQELFYKPLPQDDNKQYDIALFGTAAGQRGKWIDALKAEYGDRFYHFGGVLHGEPVLPIEEYAEAVRQTRLSVNTQTYSFREQCKGKVRECLGAGVILLEEDNNQTRELVPDGSGIMYFKDFTQLKRLINLLLADEAAQQSLIERGQQLKSEYLNASRWVKIILQHLSLINN